VGGDRHRRCAPFGVHAFEHKAVALEGCQDRVAAARNAAQRGAFDDFGYVHGRAHLAPEQRRHGSKDRGIAGPAGDHDVGIGLQRAAERLRAHLADR
jgi:hypothetical protein